MQKTSLIRWAARIGIGAVCALIASDTLVKILKQMTYGSAQAMLDAQRSARFYASLSTSDQAFYWTVKIAVSLVDPINLFFIFIFTAVVSMIDRSINGVSDAPPSQN